MKKKMKNNLKNIGEIYRDAFKDYRIEPSDKAWANIEAKLSKPASPSASLLKNNYFIAAASVVIIAVIVLIIFRNNSVNENQNRPESSEITAVITETVTENVEPTTNEPAQDFTEQHQESPEKVAEPAKNGKLKPLKAEVVVIEKGSEKAEIITNETEIKLSKTEQISTETEIALDESPGDALKSTVTNIEVKKHVAEPETTDPENTDTENLPGDMPVIPIEFPPDQKICKGEKAILQINGGTKYQWSNGDENSAITVSPPVTTVYAVTVTDAGQNPHYGNIMVEVYECMPLFVPDAFTPDGDGLNDVFLAKGTGILEFNMRIHSRSGNLIFETNDINNGWDGRINGKMAQPGVYFYTISFVDSMQKHHNLNGHITLLR